MKRVTGIGGIFFKANDPEKMKDWYKTHLGFDTDAYGTCFESRSAINPDKKVFTQWSVMSKDSETFQSGTKDFVINYRVDDLEALVEALKKEGVTVLDEIETYDYGKFVHIKDTEDNTIELWEPVDESFDKAVDGRTK